MVFNLSGQEMDKYKLCARLFNDMVGITVPRESTPSRYPAKPSAAAPTVACTPSPRIMIPKAAHTTSPQLPDTNFERLRSFDFSGESDGCADEVAVEIVSSRQAQHSAITPPTVSPIPPPYHKSVSPIPENFFNDAAWEEVHHTPSRPTAAPGPALQKVRPPAALSTSAMAPFVPVVVPVAPPPCALTTLPSRPTVAPPLLEVVSDFSFQSRVLDQIMQLLDSGSSQQRSLLSVQPTSSGKGAYAPAMSNLPSRCCRRPSLKFVPFETPFCRYTCGTHCTVYQARGGSQKKPRKRGHRQCRPENDSSSNHGTQNPLCVCLCLCLCPDVHD